MLVKKVRPWVKVSLGFSAIVITFACARQFNLLTDRVTVVQFDLKAIEEEGQAKRNSTNQ